MTELEKFQKDEARARTNLVGMALLHFFFAPFASLGYAIVLEYWTPFWVATLVAFASLIPIFLISSMLGAVLAALLFIFLPQDVAIGFGTVLQMGLHVLFGYIAPLVSFLMFRSRVLALRARVAGA